MEMYMEVCKEKIIMHIIIQFDRLNAVIKVMERQNQAKTATSSF